MNDADAVVGDGVVVVDDDGVGYDDEHELTSSMVAARCRYSPPDCNCPIDYFLVCHIHSQLNWMLLHDNSWLYYWCCWWYLDQHQRSHNNHNHW